MHRTLIVMVKEPHPGRVKTRLGRDIGLVPAAWWFRHQTAGLLRRITDPRWQTVLAVSPDAAGLRSRVWPQGIPKLPQGHGSLGDRMGRLMRSAPKGPVCVIGADIPGITRPRIARAFAKLGAADAVFGPAPDGGYWLVGLKRTRAIPPCVFEAVRWSTEYAMQDTIASLPDHRMATADTLRDVDDGNDLAMTLAVERAS